MKTEFHLLEPTPLLETEDVILCGQRHSLCVDPDELTA
jgi:hypothetical protein